MAAHQICLIFTFNGLHFQASFNEGYQNSQFSWAGIDT